MPYLLLVFQLGLAVVMLLAATGKLLNGGQFLSALRSSALPEVLVGPLAILIPVLEFFLAFGLLLSPSQALPFLLALYASVISLFTGWMLVVSIRGLHLKCGCFGTGKTEIGPGTISRNGVLLFISLGGVILAAQEPSSLPPLSLWMIVLVSSIGLSLMLLVALQRGRGALIFSSKHLRVR